MTEDINRILKTLDKQWPIAALNLRAFMESIEGKLLGIEVAIANQRDLVFELYEALECAKQHMPMGADPFDTFKNTYDAAMRKKL